MKNDWQNELYHNPKYWGKIIVIIDGKIYDFANTYFEIENKMKDKNLEYSTFHVPKKYDTYRILTFKI